MVIGACYIVVAILAVFAAGRFAAAKTAGRVAGRDYDGVSARVTVWYIVTAVLVVLGLFSLLHVEAMLADAFGSTVATEIAKAQASEHDQQQLVYVVGWALATIPISCGLLIAFRAAGELALLALAMTLALLVVVGLRALAYPDVTAFFGLNLHGLRLGDAIQLAGLVAIGATTVSRPSSSWISPKARSPRRPRYRR